MSKEEIELQKGYLERMLTLLRELEEKESQSILSLSLTETAAIYGLRYMISETSFYLKNAKH